MTFCLQDQPRSAETYVDPEAASIHSDESPETTLERTRHLLARSRMTLDAATRQLNKRDDRQDSSQHQPGKSGT